MKNKVESDAFHVGIELELKAPCEGEDHDDEACTENQREYLEQEGSRSILINYIGLSRSDADSVSSYFNTDAWIDDYLNGWHCDDSECPFRRGNGDDAREKIESDLIQLTSNTSFKVVEDGSIKIDDSSTDAEVCWNYFASRDTVKDNEVILTYLDKVGCKFNESCGLHINLNNYLKVKPQEISTEKFAFLFNYVAPSRKESTYCNRHAVSSIDKYSMIYHQTDRLEFRFFSPTLNAEKLNAYVSLAHFIYKRLAGKNVIMSKKLQKYFVDKMVNVNKLTMKEALDTINKTNNITQLIEVIENVA